MYTTFPDRKASSNEGDSLYFNFDKLFPMVQTALDSDSVFLVSTDSCEDGNHCAVCVPFANESDVANYGWIVLDPGMGIREPLVFVPDTESKGPNGFS